MPGAAAGGGHAARAWRRLRPDAAGGAAAAWPAGGHSGRDAALARSVGPSGRPGIQSGPWGGRPSGPARRTGSAAPCGSGGGDVTAKAADQAAAPGCRTSRPWNSRSTRCRLSSAARNRRRGASPGGRRAAGSCRQQAPARADLACRGGRLERFQRGSALYGQNDPACLQAAAARCRRSCARWPPSWAASHGTRSSCDGSGSGSLPRHFSKRAGGRAAA